MSVRALKGNGRWWALAGCLLWLAFTLFPLYWVVITSFKSPLGVVGGPTYIPFVDFEPTLSAWSDFFRDSVASSTTPSSRRRSSVCLHR